MRAAYEPEFIKHTFELPFCKRFVFSLSFLIHPLSAKTVKWLSIMVDAKVLRKKRSKNRIYNFNFLMTDKSCENFKRKLETMGQRNWQLGSKTAVILFSSNLIK